MTKILRRSVKKYTATGKLDPNYGAHNLAGASAITMTLVAPDPYKTGTILDIVCTTAFAHVVTTSGGFGGDSNQTSFTFRGVIGDSLTVIAIDSLWYVVRGENSGQFDLTQNYSASGALDPNFEVHSIDVAGVGAMTLAAATAALEGRKMYIVSTTANAHTVTYTPGFGGLGASGDVATFGAAVGNSMSIVCVDAVWHVINLHNVTLA